jgi:hypothetical protein
LGTGWVSSTGPPRLAADLVPTALTSARSWSGRRPTPRARGRIRARKPANTRAVTGTSAATRNGRRSEARSKPVGQRVERHPGQFGLGCRLSAMPHRCLLSRIGGIATVVCRDEPRFAKRPGSAVRSVSPIRHPRAVRKAPAESPASSLCRCRLYRRAPRARDAWPRARGPVRRRHGRGLLLHHIALGAFPFLQRLGETPAPATASPAGRVSTPHLINYRGSF